MHSRPATGSSSTTSRSRCCTFPATPRGHICLLERERGILYAGDTLLARITPNPLLEPTPEDPNVRRRSLIEYMQSLDALEALELTKVWPGHGAPVLEPAQTIRRIKRHHIERKEEIAALLVRQEDGRSPFELARAMFRDLEGFDNFLAVSEVVAHLDLLEEEGRAEPFVRQGVTHYRAPGAA